MKADASLEPGDVPSPIDLTAEADACAWAAQALSSRPWRVDFFDAFAGQIAQASARAAGHPRKVLELGSGPGFLAEHLLSRLPALEMWLLDSSEPMQRMAQERLQAFAARVRPLLRSFKAADWPDGLSGFDHVVTHQAVHELRHKRYALALHQAVRTVLAPGGSYLVCDHYVGGDGMQNTELYMTIDEQRDTLRAAGFSRVEPVLQLKGLVLHRAER